MSERPLISMCLIAKDEKRNIARCFASWWDHVDEVVLADTGSRDGTIAEAKRYAKRKGQPGKLTVTRVKWSDDFAAARQAADDLATGEFIAWCDLDDEILGMENLRQYAAAASPDVVGFFAVYSYARDPDGNAISELWRERLVRNDGTKWTGRLHEHKLFTHGQVVKVSPDVARWVHHRDHTVRTGERNLRILEAWDQEEPDSSRVLQSLAMEYMGAERHKEAADAFARFLGLRGEPADRRAQAARHRCQMLLVQGQVAEARTAALNALSEHWLWADTHLSLAEVEQTLGNPEVAITHAQQALTLGKPDTLLIVNPLQYTAHPLALMALCHAQAGRFDKAVEHAEECLRIAPSYQLASQYLPGWRGQLKRQQTLATWMASCEVLVEVGELLKARTLLSSAPFYISRDPALCQRRAEIARMIDERVASPQAADEDEAADKFVQRHLQEAA